MTKRRRQVLKRLGECAANGERVTMAELARRCGLYDYRHARRIVKDLREMGAVVDSLDSKARFSSGSRVERGRVECANRRAQALGASGAFTRTDIIALMERQQKSCALCRAHLAGGYHIDHVVPLNAHGSNEIGNIQLLCPPCNIAKGDNLPENNFRTVHKA